MLDSKNTEHLSLARSFKIHHATLKVHPKDVQTASVAVQEKLPDRPCPPSGHLSGVKRTCSCVQINISHARCTFFLFSMLTRYLQYSASLHWSSCPHSSWSFPPPSRAPMQRSVAAVCSATVNCLFYVCVCVELLHRRSTYPSLPPSNVSSESPNTRPQLVCFWCGQHGRYRCPWPATPARDEFQHGPRAPW